MAEIHLEHKERTAWPWVLVGLVLLALVAWWFLGQRGGDAGLVMQDQPGDVAETRDVRTVEGAPSEVNGFLRFVDENRARDDAGIDHSYTADGMRQLADALRAIAARDDMRRSTLEPRIELIRERADALQRNPDATTHAGFAREGFTTAAEVMETLQQRHAGAQADVQQVRQTANSIEQGTPLLNQKQRVQQFFEHSANALRTLAESEQRMTGTGMGTDTGTMRTGTDTMGARTGAGRVPPRY